MFSSILQNFSGSLPTSTGSLALMAVGGLLAFAGMRVLLRPWLMIPLLVGAAYAAHTNQQIFANPTHMLPVAGVVAFILCSMLFLRSCAAMLVRGVSVGVWGVALVLIGSQIQGSGLTSKLGLGDFDSSVISSETLNGIWAQAASFSDANGGGELTPAVAAIGSASSDLLAEWSMDESDSKAPALAEIADSDFVVSNLNKVTGKSAHRMQPTSFGEGSGSYRIRFGSSELTRF